MQSQWKVIATLVYVLLQTRVDASPQQDGYQLYKDGQTSEDGLNTDDEFLFADDWTQSLIEPHILWSKGDLRLMVNDEVVGTGAGRLEMYLGSNYMSDGSGEVESEGSWGTVCGDEFSLAAANVACRQMGFKYATGWNYTIYTPYGSANDSMPIAVSDISCSASYFWHFMRCDVDYGNLDEDCSHRQDVAVFCSVENIWEAPYQGQVRLMNSLTNTTIHSYGRVEVYQNGQWGTVCNKGFSQEGADSVCRQLGYTGAVFTGSAFPGSGAIHVKDLTCDSSQSCFTDCFQPHVLIHDCNHTMDVAIQCQFDLSEAEEYSAGYKSNCAINKFPLLIVLFGVILGLAAVFMVGCVVVLMVSITRCCYKCRSKKNRYEELY